MTAAAGRAATQRQSQQQEESATQHSTDEAASEHLCQGQDMGQNIIQEVETALRSSSHYTASMQRSTSTALRIIQAAHMLLLLPPRCTLP
jgi:hypothetical protein